MRGYPSFDVKQPVARALAKKEKKHARKGDGQRVFFYSNFSCLSEEEGERRGVQGAGQEKGTVRIGVTSKTRKLRKTAAHKNSVKRKKRDEQTALKTKGDSGPAHAGETSALSSQTVYLTNKLLRAKGRRTRGEVHRSDGRTRASQDRSRKEKGAKKG